jgi:hypothetical protein
MNNPISPFEKWRLETIPQVGFTPEIRELLAMAFEGGRQSVAEKQEPVAWMSENAMNVTRFKDIAQHWVQHGGSAIPLYTHPATWQSSKEKNAPNN